MKNILYTLLFSLTLMFGGCDSFLETTPEQQIDSDVAFAKVSDANAAINGLYYRMGSYYFAGNYAIAIGDFASDIAKADGSSGHFVSINDYTFADYTGEISDMWEVGYKIISGATDLISNVDALSEAYPAELEDIKLYEAQAHALRAYSYFLLVNIYGLPYGTSVANGGLVLMDETPIPVETPVSRSTVEQTYTLILKDIDAALAAYGETSASVNEYYFNKAAVYALASRVNLFMKDYKACAEYAQMAIDERNGTPVDNAQYLEMWKSISLSNEDIFTIAKTSDDNLSANSLNTLYGSYGGAVTQSLISDFEATDIRLGLIKGTHPKKFDGIASSAATSNIPQFRVSEMYLNLAEAKASGTTPDLAAARTALLFTAKRNTAIVTVDDLPADQAGLLAFIAKERKREFFCEGHRWYDARRTGELINAKGDLFTNFDVAKFVFPIPSSEINSGFQCEPNENWDANLPQ
ncbi:RagB/SusD family nutrient uptake outer membrane protein [Marinifilum sp. RC60d5]|uniref:RagB/SusD family nutrient uptake outer membrane protein n=1 Tax=Marinifilum sp. RC60d5 TaxID=3458414 RepID=UPI00403602CF